MSGVVKIYQVIRIRSLNYLDTYTRQKIHNSNREVVKKASLVMVKASSLTSFK